MSKLPKIFHNNNKCITNNKNSFNTFNLEKKDIISSFDSNILINYFNKKINIHLKDGKVCNGVLISKRGNTILLNNGEKINIKEIDYVN